MPRIFIAQVTFLLVLVMVFCLPSRGFAQVVAGQVVDSITEIPVGSGFVVLMDDVGNEVARALTDGEGRFELRAPRDGVYFVKSERIGFRAFVSEPIHVTGTGRTTTSLLVSALPVQLSAVIVPGGGDCKTNPEEGANTVVIWEEIRKALTATVWSEQQELFYYEMYGYRRDLDRRRQRVLNEIGERVARFTDPPYRSIPADSLARNGYIVDREDGTWYYMPDAQVLLDPSFLDTHCFHVQRDERHRPGLVGLAFEPLSERRRPDVEGALWLDEETSELRELEVQHTYLRYEVEDERIGGTIRFLMLPSGAWIVRDWEIRTPKLTVTRESRGTRSYASEVDGFADTGGEIYRVSTRDGTTVYQAPVSTITGTIFDSTRSTPLRGAVVFVVGTNFRARSDSVGRYELRVPLTGQYSVSVRHPRLDSLAISYPVQPVQLTRDSLSSFSVVVPGMSTLFTRRCSENTITPRSRMIVGVVRDAGTGAPMEGVAINASWQTIDIANQIVSVGNLSERVETANDGIYAICDVPTLRPILLRAEKGDRSSREVSVVFPRELGDLLQMSWGRNIGRQYDRQYVAADPIWKVDLSLGTESERSQEARLTPAVFGVVTDSSTGEPVPGATVLFNNSLQAVTGDNGWYLLEGVSWNSSINRIEVRKLGFEPTYIDVQNTNSVVRVQLDFSLPQLAVRMTEVVVEGERISVPQRLAGFYQRREIGIGEYLTEDDWENLPDYNVAQVLHRRPGITVAGWRVLISDAPFTCRRTGTSARVWVDGVSVNPDFIQDMDINSIFSIEVYRRLTDTPAQFNSSADQVNAIGRSASSGACGVVIIWTR